MSQATIRVQASVRVGTVIEKGTVQCIVEQLDLATGNTAGQDGDTLVMR